MTFPTFTAPFTLTLEDSTVAPVWSNPVGVECRAHCILDNDEGRPVPIVQGYSVKRRDGEWETANGILHDMIDAAFVEDETWLLDCASEQIGKTDRQLRDEICGEDAA